MNLVNDLSSYWMPFTANRRFKASPRMLVAADGMYYTGQDGRKILDGTAGLWCCNAGHNRPTIVEAVQRQIATLDYAPSFQLGHPGAFELSSRLLELTSNDFAQVFFANSGSEAVDTALKIALGYHKARGEPARTLLIGRERSYHGVGFGGVSVGGISSNRALFSPLLPNVDHLRHTHDPSRNRWARGLPTHGAEFADDLLRLIESHGASTIAAVIVEPVAGSTGVLMPPEGYLLRLRQICDEHGILLIFDEVITGFGRIGASFAYQKFGVTPDMVVMAKGITNGCVPMGGVLIREGIYDAFLDAAEDGEIELPHGYTYSGHPLACAAALACLDLYRDEQLFARAASLAGYWEERLHSLRDTRHVVDIRNFGLIGAVELEPRSPEAAATRASDAFRECFARGVLIRATADTIALSPPLIVEQGQIDEIVSTLAAVLDEVA